MKDAVFHYVLLGAVAFFGVTTTVSVCSAPTEEERRAAAYEWLRRHGRAQDAVSCRPHGPLCDVLPPAPGNPYVLLCGRKTCRLEVER